MGDVAKAIREAEALLPGVPVEDGRDPRWQAIIAVGEHIEDDPEPVWGFISRWGGHAQADLRAAVATCLLEHLLEHHFAAYFPRVEERARADILFADTFLSCSAFGLSKEGENAARFEALKEKLSAQRDRSEEPERRPRFVEMIDLHILIVCGMIAVMSACSPWWWAQLMFLAPVAMTLTHFHDRLRHGWGYHWTYLISNAALIAVFVAMVALLRYVFLG
jgi:hypothetical protein